MTFMAALFFVSCEQDNINDEYSSPSAQAKSVNVLAADCTAVTGSAVVNRTGTNTGDYCAWTPTTKTIGSIQVDFEGIYGSGIRVKTSGWFMGTVSATYTCAGGWDDSAVTVKNASSANIGVDPACGSFIPQNVVGAIGSAYGSNFGNVGYYTYNSTTHAITITRKVVIWKDTTTSYPAGNSNPSNATEAYLLQITSIVPTHGATVYGTINYSYTKIL